MCVVSMIGDGWSQQFPERWPTYIPSVPVPVPTTGINIQFPEVSRAEFEALRKEMQELRELLIAAKKFDAATGQPECENDAKIALIKAVAKAVGVDMGTVFGPDG